MASCEPVSLLAEYFFQLYAKVPDMAHMDSRYPDYRALANLSFLLGQLAGL